MIYLYDSYDTLMILLYDLYDTHMIYLPCNAKGFIIGKSKQNGYGSGSESDWSDGEGHESHGNPLASSHQKLNSEFGMWTHVFCCLSRDTTYTITHNIYNHTHLIQSHTSYTITHILYNQQNQQNQKY